MYRNESAPPFAYHYDGVNAVNPIPRPLAYDVFDPMEFVVNDIGEIDSVIENSGISETAWLVMDQVSSLWGVDFNRDKVVAYFEERFDVISQREFSGTTVQLISIVSDRGDGPR